jgi:hypothetical protein
VTVSFKQDAWISAYRAVGVAPRVGRQGYQFFETVAPNPRRPLTSRRHTQSADFDTRTRFRPPQVLQVSGPISLSLRGVIRSATIAAMRPDPVIRPSARCTAAECESGRCHGRCFHKRHWVNINRPPSPHLCFVSFLFLSLSACSL